MKERLAGGSVGVEEQMLVNGSFRNSTLEAMPSTSRT